MAKPTQLSIKVIIRRRYSLIEKLEKILGQWMDDQNQKLIPVDYIA